MIPVNVAWFAAESCLANVIQECGCRLYRRGTLFRFTLAEIVLLIIFALLLALAEIIQIKDRRIKELQQAENGMVRVTESDARQSACIVRIVPHPIAGKAWTPIVPATYCATAS
jgi:hypothetical protein